MTECSVGAVIVVCQAHSSVIQLLSHQLPLPESAADFVSSCHYRPQVLLLLVSVSDPWSWQRSCHPEPEFINSIKAVKQTLSSESLHLEANDMSVTDLYSVFYH